MLKKKTGSDTVLGMLNKKNVVLGISRIPRPCAAGANSDTPEKRGKILLLWLRSDTAGAHSSGTSFIITLLFFAESVGTRTAPRNLLRGFVDVCQRRAIICDFEAGIQGSSLFGNPSRKTDARQFLWSFVFYQVSKFCSTKKLKMIFVEVKNIFLCRKFPTKNPK